MKYIPQVSYFAMLFDFNITIFNAKVSLIFQVLLAPKRIDFVFMYTWLVIDEPFTE